MRNLRTAWRRYLLAYAGALAAGLILIAAAAIAGQAFLRGSGEIEPAAAVAIQMAHPECVFGSGVHEDFITYKRALLAARAPTIVALGSSRVMQFSQRFFSARFANLGGSVNSVAQLEARAKELPPQVDVVLLGLDIWWYSSPAGRPTEGPALVPPPPQDDATAALRRLLQPFVLVWDGKVTRSTFMHYAAVGAGGELSCPLGIQAIETGHGFASDGAYVYAALVEGRRPSADPGFSGTLRRIEEGIDPFDKRQFDPSLVARTVAVVKALRARGVTVVPFLPPFAGTVMDAMRDAEGRFRHFDQTRAMLAQQLPDISDFTEPETIPADTCGFVDGMHGGNIIYAQILAKLASRPAYPALDAAVAHAELARIIELGRGRASLALREVDFLGIGCVRPPPP